MRVFLAALLSAVVFGAIALFVLGATQRSSTVAYTTEGARIHPSCSFRALLRRSDQARVGQVANNGAGLNPSAISGQLDESGAASNGCDQAGALSMIFIDFGDTAKDAGCSS